MVSGLPISMNVKSDKNMPIMCVCVCECACVRMCVCVCVCVPKCGMHGVSAAKSACLRLRLLYSGENKVLYLRNIFMYLSPMSCVCVGVCAWMCVCECLCAGGE